MGRRERERKEEERKKSEKFRREENGCENSTRIDRQRKSKGTGVRENEGAEE